MTSHEVIIRMEIFCLILPKTNPYTNVEYFDRLNEKSKSFKPFYYTHTILTEHLDVDSCVPSPCINGGKCHPVNPGQNSGGNFTCECPIQYKGPICQCKCI